MAVGNMLRVLKGNQETLISPANKEKYLNKGYNVIDEDGTVLEQGIKSQHTINVELEAANKRIRELEEENARLKEMIEQHGSEDNSGQKKGRGKSLAE